MEQASSGSFDCVWRKKPRQTPLRMTFIYAANFRDTTLVQHLLHYPLQWFASGRTYARGEGCHIAGLSLAVVSAIAVELQSLTVGDFIRILTEPKS